MSEVVVQETAMVHSPSQPSYPVVAVVPTVDEFRTLTDLATRIADTEFVPDTLRKRPAAVLSCILAGRELGVGPMQSLQKISIIKGRPSPQAELMRALVLKAGHRIDVVKYDAESVTIVGQRRGEERVLEVTWGLADTQRAELQGGNHKKYPRSMYLARATSELCRAMFPDVLCGFSYAPEDLEDLPDPDPVKPVPTPPTRATATIHAAPETPPQKAVEPGATVDWTSQLSKACDAIRKQMLHPEGGKREAFNEDHVNYLLTQTLANEQLNEAQKYEELRARSADILKVRLTPAMLDTDMAYIESPVPDAPSASDVVAKPNVAEDFADPFSEDAPDTSGAYPAESTSPEAAEATK